MATVLEQYPTEEQRSVVRLFFFLANGITEKDNHKEMLPVYDGK
jgi:hypothetical protein